MQINSCGQNGACSVHNVSRKLTLAVPGGPVSSACTLDLQDLAAAICLAAMHTSDLLHTKIFLFCMSN